MKFLKVAILTVFLGSFSPSFAGETTLSKIVGKLGLVQGQVTVNDKSVRSGSDVREGSIVEVKKGQATILLGKGSVVQLASDSKMVVTQFGVSAATGEESGDLDLKFGRTRALILNQGSEKKDIKIKARSATMGVRGTEVYVDVPKDASKPAQFFTLEGSAVVATQAAVAPTVVNQNQGVVAGGANASAPPVAHSSTGEQMRAQVQSAGLAPPPPMRNIQDVNAVAAAGQKPPGAQLPDQTNIGNGFLGDQMNGKPPIQFDPLSDRIQTVRIVPTFVSVGQ